MKIKTKVLGNEVFKLKNGDLAISTDFIKQMIGHRSDIFGALLVIAILQKDEEFLDFEIFKEHCGQESEEELLEILDELNINGLIEIEE